MNKSLNHFKHHHLDIYNYWLLETAIRHMTTQILLICIQCILYILLSKQIKNVLKKFLSNYVNKCSTFNVLPYPSQQVFITRKKLE